MKELLFKRKFKFILYVVACCFPIGIDLLRMIIISNIFGAIEFANMDRFIRLISLMGGYILFDALTFITSRFLRISYMRDTILDVRIAAFDKILNSSYRFFNQKSKEVYISNLINDINNFETNFFLNMINFIFRTGLYIVSAVIIFFNDWKLGLAIVGASVIIFFLSKQFQSKTTRLQKTVSSDNEKFTVEMANTLNGLEILKLNNIEDKYIHKSFDSIHRIERSKFNFRFFTESQRTFTNILGFTLSIGVLLYLLSQYQNGITYQTIFFMIFLSNNMAFALQDIFPRLNVIRSSSEIYDKITKQEKENYINGKVNEFVFNHQIEVQHLTFLIEGKEIFKDANFTIEKGKKYLIKGPSGVGKSTLIKLLSFIYEDYEGTILIDGVDIRTIKDKSFQNSVSYIYQDIFLFEDTIKNNITLFKDLKQGNIDKAIHDAGLVEFIQAKEAGMEEIISENGKNLSGGERQRIAIARAIAKDAQILFVDEGTSALNEDLGRQVESSLIHLDSTVVSISHRFYKGISEAYDFVLDLKDKKITTYLAKDYFREEAQYA